jgi:hypothetical protein
MYVGTLYTYAGQRSVPLPATEHYELLHVRERDAAITTITFEQIGSNPVQIAMIMGPFHAINQFPAEDR